MAEAGLTRDQVQASGKDGRVMKEDVARAVAVPRALRPLLSRLRLRPPRSTRACACR